MPRAFLIKKKRVQGYVTSTGAGEVNNNMDHQHRSAENKENLEEFARGTDEQREAGRKEEMSRAVVRQERTERKMLAAERRATEEEEEEEEMEEEEEGADYSSCEEESRSSGNVPVSTASPVSDLGSPAHGAFQQFPTDLSLKTTTTTTSSVSPLPHHTPVRSSSASPHRSSHLPPQFPPSKQERSSHFAPEYRQGSRSGSGSPRRESSSPPAGGHPPLLKPCKRPSDFSTAFLLSHHSTPKRSYSPPPPAPPAADVDVPAPAPGRTLCPYPYPYPPPPPPPPPPHPLSQNYPAVSSTSPRPTEASGRRGSSEDLEKKGGAGGGGGGSAGVLPSKFTPPCLSVSAWLDSPPAGGALMASAYQHQLGRCREDRTSTSSSSLEPPSPGRDSGRCFPSPLGVRRGEDGPSAFRRSDSAAFAFAAGLPGQDLSPRKGDYSARKGTSPLSVSPRGDETSPPERRVPSTSPRDSVFLSPQHELLTSRLLLPSAGGAGPLPLSLSLGNPGEVRRGTSTSPAHSERTSSGCGSPTESQDGSPPLSRYPGDLAWGRASSSPSPFLPPHVLPPGASGPPSSSSSSSSSQHLQHHHPFLPLGLRYLPALPFPGVGKPPPLSDMLAYPKSLTDGLASAFRSTRPSFVHPAAAAAAAAAAAYYSSIRSSLPYPFAFPSPASQGADGKAVPAEELLEQRERLEMLRTLRKDPFDSMAAFHPPHPHPPHPHPPPAPLSQHQQQQQQPQPPTSLHIVPGAGGPVLSPRLSPGSSSSSAVDVNVNVAAGRSPELTELPRGLGVGVGVPAGMGAAAAVAAALGLEGRGLKARGKEHEPVRYQCEACSKSYSTFSGLSKHKQFHCSAQVKKEFSCKYCEKTYVSLGALKMHIRTHTLPCKCSVCGKAFSRPWLLQGHLRTHTGEKPFSCPHCARAFADRSNLRAHLQTHSDVKKYSCRHCSKTFSRMSLLLKHEDGCCAHPV